MNFELSKKQKFDTHFLALRHFLHLADNQEYFDWANELLQSKVFFHELAMIVSFEYTENSVFYYENLNENLDIAFAKFGFNFPNKADVYGQYQAYDEEQAKNDLIYLYCHKILKQQISLTEGLDEIYWLSYDIFAGYVNAWSFLFDEMTIEKSNPDYQAKVLQAIQDYIRYYDSCNIKMFYKKMVRTKQNQDRLKL